VVQELAASVVAVDGDDDVRPGAVDAVRERLRGEAREHWSGGAPMRAHESIVTGRDGNIGRWAGDDVVLLDVHFEHRGHLVDPVVQVLVRDVPALVGVGPSQMKAAWFCVRRGGGRCSCRRRSASRP